MTTYLKLFKKKKLYDFNPVNYVLFCYNYLYACVILLHPIVCLHRSYAKTQSSTNIPVRKIKRGLA